jgi:hypothetical protein
MHDGSMADTVHLSVAALRELFANGWQLMNCGILDYQIWICVTIFLWSTLKDKIYVNSPHSLNNWRMILKERLPIFEDKNSVMC